MGFFAALFVSRLGPLAKKQKNCGSTSLCFPLVCRICRVTKQAPPSPTTIGKAPLVFKENAGSEAEIVLTQAQHSLCLLRASCCLLRLSIRYSASSGAEGLGSVGRDDPRHGRGICGHCRQGQACARSPHLVWSIASLPEVAM